MSSGVREFSSRVWEYLVNWISVRRNTFNNIIKQFGVIQKKCGKVPISLKLNDYAKSFLIRMILEDKTKYFMQSQRRECKVVFYI